MTLLVAAGFGSATQAQDTGPLAALSADTFLEPLPVVLSVSRLAQPLADAPGAVTVIDAEMIRSSGARDLGDLLRMVPGFLAAHSINGAPNAVYHGMTDENPRGLQILVDGRSQYSPLFFGGIAWNVIDVSLDDIERIEVLRGSNSAAYGSNAFLGVVNVVTKAAEDAAGGRVRLRQGNAGVEDRYARVGFKVGDAALRVSAESVRDEGVQHYDDNRRNGRVNLRADLPLGSGREVQLQAGVADMSLDVGVARNGLNPQRDQSARKEFVSLSWHQTDTDGGGLLARYTRSAEHYDDSYVARSGPLSLLVDYETRTSRDEIEIQHTLLPGATTRLVWGVGARFDAVRAPQFYNTNGEVRQRVHRLFGNFEWRPSALWTTNLGMTWENDSLSGTSLAPRLAVNYHLSAEQTLRAGVTRAHRIPSLTEARGREYYGALDLGPPLGVRPLEIDRNASGDLKPESLDAFELGYLADFRDQAVFVDVRAFLENVRDRITPVDLPLTPPNCDVVGVLEGGCGFYKDYLNTQDLKIYGIEYQLRWKPIDSGELTLNQAFTRVDSRAGSRLRSINASMASDVERHMDHSAPELATMIRWAQRLNWGLEASLTYYHYDRFQWTRNSAVGPFERTDVRLAYPFRAGPTRGELALTVQGLGTRAPEYRAGGADRDNPAERNKSPQDLAPRAWLSLVLEI